MIIEVFGCLFYCATIPRNPLITLENNTKNKASIYSTKGLPFLFLLPTKWKPWTLAAFVVSWAPHKKPSNKIFCSFRCTFPWQERNVLGTTRPWVHNKENGFCLIFFECIFSKNKTHSKGKDTHVRIMKRRGEKNQFSSFAEHPPFYEGSAPLILPPHVLLTNKDDGRHPSNRMASFSLQRKF